MVRKVDIVDFNPSDGLTPLQTKKLNWNFKHLFDALGGVDVDQAGSVKSLVIGTHDLAVDQKATVVKKGTKNNVIVEIGIPAAQVSITDAQVDSVLANDAPTGTQVLRLTQLSRLWAGIKQYVDNAIGAIGSFVLKAGDTMTGSLRMKTSSIDRDGANPSADQASNEYTFYDKDDEQIGKVVCYRRTDGRIDIHMNAINEKSDGTSVTNTFQVRVANDGTCTYYMSSPANFRTAIDAAASSHNHAASNITSGTLALARGGTASDNTARAINTVFAGPSSGSAGNASWRALVAADIPNLNASKITAGTLGADRIPNLNASKITAGTLGADRIPTLSTSKISGLGTYKSANKTGLSVAANVDTITTGPSLSLEAGSWYVMAMGTFQSNTGAGARLCQTAIGNTATGGQYTGRQRVYNAGGNYEMVIANAFVVVSATTTVYGQISCSTSVSNNSCWIGAIRIK